MSRKPRSQSPSNIYHIMQRGVGLFDVFEDDDDREAYISFLGESSLLYGVEVYAWCLMSNHVHLVVRAPIEAISKMMHQLGSKYARRFNRKHGRVGHLFQGRFASVPVADETQLLTLVRYVHRNPIRHEKGVPISEYPWSSYSQYASGERGMAATELVLGIHGSSESFVAYTAVEGDDGFMDVDCEASISDDRARALANEALGTAGVSVLVTQVGRLVRSRRDEALGIVASLGLKLRQIQRLTGINYNAVRSAAIDAGVWVPNNSTTRVQTNCAALHCAQLN